MLGTREGDNTWEKYQLGRSSSPTACRYHRTWQSRSQIHNTWPDGDPAGLEEQFTTSCLITCNSWACVALCVFSESWWRAGERLSSATLKSLCSPWADNLNLNELILTCLLLPHTLTHFSHLSPEVGKSMHVNLVISAHIQSGWLTIFKSDSFFGTSRHCSYYKRKLLITLCRNTREALIS